MILAPLMALGLLASSPPVCARAMMGTEIVVELPGLFDRRAACEAVFTAFSEVEERMNEWRPESPLGAVNQSAGRDSVEVPPDLYALIERSLEIGRLTDGAFDISWAALWGLWDFRGQDPRPPAAEALAKRLPLVDYRLVELDAAHNSVRLPKAGMALGLGGIAKGYALERARGRLQALGVQVWAITAGGQVLVAGQPQGRAWRVGIRDPRGPAQDAFGMLTVNDASVSTSGDYERYFMWLGRRYHHILDPRTGQPSRGLRSASVVAADPTLADALSTACMVLGKQGAIALVGRMKGVEAVLVDDQGQVWRSAGLEPRLEILHAPRVR